MEADIRRILSEIRPEEDFSSSDDFMADGLLDSYDMIVLITELEQAFQVAIDGVDIVPEHFANTAAIAALVERSKSAT
jgi:acyl carrier protein